MCATSIPTTRENVEVARVLREIARHLRDQGANPFRRIAYERAADTIEQMEANVGELLRRRGVDGLVELPHIGAGLAATIEEIVRSGRSTQLDRLRGEADPQAILRSVPGIGPILARSIHECLHIDTLEALEVAAHDGRLATLPRLGERRVAAIRASVAGILGSRRTQLDSPHLPPVALILDIDRQYRQGVAAGELPKIAPRRFNPDKAAWLPILHGDRDGQHFTALFSNTARAHTLGRTNDWVVVYCYDGEHRESQHTVVTETHGPLQGRRVVRGRETECLQYYNDTRGRR